MEALLEKKFDFSTRKTVISFDETSCASLEENTLILNTSLLSNPSRADADINGSNGCSPMQFVISVYCS
jgi:hypothetical protein